MLETTCKPDSKVLVVYFSHTGVARKLAQTLREKTCGVLFGVEPRTPYTSCMVEEAAKREVESGGLPFLRYSVPCMSAYDAILFGGPVWLPTLPPPLMSFLRHADFRGRPVAPFCLHGGDSGAFFQDLTKQAKNARLLEGLSLCCQGRESSKTGEDWPPEALLESWLHKLGLFQRMPLVQSRRERLSAESRKKEITPYLHGSSNDC